MYRTHLNHTTKYTVLCDMLTLICTEHTSTTPPVNETDYCDFKHEDKGTDQVLNFRDGICRTES